MNQDYKRNASLADTFLYMPFNIENLKIKISVLIKNYRFLRKSFLQKIFGEKFLETDIEEMPEEDNYQLINKVKKFILDNLDNESLKISHIASETGMSRTKFFIKWKFLTGEAPIEFMTRIRMEKARELLESRKYSFLGGIHGKVHLDKTGPSACWWLLRFSLIKYIKNK